MKSETIKLKVHSKFVKGHIYTDAKKKVCILGFEIKKIIAFLFGLPYYIACFP